MVAKSTLPLLVLLGLPRATGSDFADLRGVDSHLRDLHGDLQELVDGRAKAWNCSFSVALRSPALSAEPLTFVAGAGVKHATKFSWGSITKMWTGAAIMQLVANGHLKLDEPAAPRVNAQLKAMKAKRFPGMSFSTLEELFGPEVSKVTIRQLLAMQSGIPDYDTANPSKKELDPFRALVYRHPEVDFTVPLLMSLKWVATGQLDFSPGSHCRYSSTNFEILGLILAQHAGLADYRLLNQSSFIPDALHGINVSWAVAGSPRDHGVIAGFDRTYYNGQEPNVTGGVPIVDVHGVFAGWSCADVVSTPAALAELGYNLWGKPSAIVPQKFRDMMLPGPDQWYGLATFNLGSFGITGDDNTAYGHLGATYGYDSLFAYVPAFDLAIAIGTDLESPTQTQPMDTFCLVYNRIRNFVEGRPAETCSWTTWNYYGGECKCTTREDATVVV